MTETLATAIRAVEIFAARHPRPSHVTQKQAAEMLGRSEPTIRKMIERRVFRLNACGRNRTPPDLGGIPFLG